mmetsp:Transcript_42943/g.122451  ORF Transcript_42943/g.122451 Transcript_42943/m.122451 type:complete len:278 (-) Transcript_42943:300-1133(-)
MRARKTSSGYVSDVAVMPAPAPARNRLAGSLRSGAACRSQALYGSKVAKDVAENGTTRRSVALWPRQRPRTPSSRTMDLPVLNALRQLKRREALVWKRIFTRSPGAMIVFATAPAIPPQARLWMALSLWPPPAVAAWCPPPVSGAYWSPSWYACLWRMNPLMESLITKARPTVTGPFTHVSEAPLKRPPTTPSAPVILRTASRVLPDLMNSLRSTRPDRSRSSRCQSSSLGMPRARARGATSARQRSPLLSLSRLLKTCFKGSSPATCMRLRTTCNG